MDWTTLTRLLPELALAMLFAWFVERREAQAIIERAKRDDEWREFLLSINNATVQAMERISDTLTAHDARLSGVEHVVTAYSAKFDEAISAMRAALGTRKGDTGPIGHSK